MGEALGVDLRATAVAAARWRDGEAVPCQLGDSTATVAATELLATGSLAGSAESGDPAEARPSAAAAIDAEVADGEVADGEVADGEVADAEVADGEVADGEVVDADPLAVTSRLLAGAVERALAGDAAGTVAVTYPLAPDDGSRALVEQATAAMFDDAFIVARPVAAAARFVYGDDGRQAAHVAVLDMSERAVDVAIVRCARDGFDLVGEPTTLPDPGHETDMAEHLDRAVSLLEASVAGAGLAEAEIDAVLVVGSSDWLSQLALQAKVGTGLVVATDPQPEVAAALGAALLAGGPERRGRTRPVAAAGSGLLPGAGVPHASPVAPTSSGPTGAGEATGAVVGEMVEGADVGGHLGAAAADAITGAPRPLKDRPGSGAPAGPGGGVGAAVGSHGRRIGSALGRVVGASRAGRRRRVLVSAAAVAGLLVLGAGVRALVAEDGPDSVEIGESSSGALTTTTTERPASTRSDPTAKPGVDDTARSTTTAPGPTDEAGPVDPTTPEGSAVPGGSVGTGSAGAPGGGTPGDSPSPPPPPAPPSDDPAPLTTLPADTAPPTISGVSRVPGTITEDDGEFCVGPFTTQLAATVHDPSGVQQVTANWSGNGTSGSLSMSASGGSWSGTLGPVAGNAALSYPQTGTITWSVTAVDTAGNSASVAGPAITIQGC